MKRIAILGSTGSIGQQTLEIIAQYPTKFKAVILTSNNQVDLLIKQAIQFKPQAVVIANKNLYRKAKNALKVFPVLVYAGSENIAQIVTADYIDVVVGAMVGFSGLHPIINAIKTKKQIALANKETLVVAGELINFLCKKFNVKILPIDSEHSAIFQCLLGEDKNKIEKIILTASGGPFLGRDFNTLKYVLPNEALKHPTWKMGRKITVDSATLMNKGLEAIEAKWLFHLEAKQIEIVIHPQSIIHSMVQFTDSSIKAQMGLPDMKHPILYALSYPNRLATNFDRLSFAKYLTLTFLKPSYEEYACLKLAYFALEKGKNIPCVLNAANEVAVNAFLDRKIYFTDIPTLIEKCMKEIPIIDKPSYDDYIQTHDETTTMACKMLNKL